MSLASKNPPAALPPHGVTPNFENPPNGRVAGNALLSLFLIVSTAAFVMRIYTKWVSTHRILIADYVLISAYAAWIITIALLFHANHAIGLFVHQYDLHYLSLTTWFYDIFIIRDTWLIFIPAIKGAILLEWIHIFSPRGTRGFVFWACHTVLWTNTAFYVIELIFSNKGCDAQAVIKDKIISQACKQTWTSWTGPAAASINAVTDLAIMIIPQKVIWQLHMGSPTKKLRVAAVFAIGMLGTIAAIARLTITLIGSKSTDGTFYFSYVMMACLAEGLCAFLVITAPVTPKAFTSLHSWMSSTVGRLSFTSNSQTFDSTMGSSSKANAYVNIKERPIPLRNVDTSSSTEYLRSEHSQSNMGHSAKFETGRQKAMRGDLENQTHY